MPVRNRRGGNEFRTADLRTPTNIALVSEILDAVRAGASGETLSSTPMPTTTRAVFVRREDQDMFAGVASIDKDPRRSLRIDEGCATRIGPRRSISGGHGVVD
jgi:hypothetical protein